MVSAVIAKQRLPRLDEVDVEFLRDIRLVLFDFDGVFTRNSVLVDQTGVERVFPARRVRIGLAEGVRSRIE